ncbi:MAG: hypothetical protein ABIF77_07840 [bacterium]
MTFLAVAGGSDPVDQQVVVSNTGAGDLTGLAANITYTSGQPAG